MKIFLSALENSGYSQSCWLAHLDEMPFKMKWNLMSFFYLRGNINRKRGLVIRDNSELVLIDSGAHSFQKGKKVNWDSYTEQYAAFIRNFDRPNVLGYFEMDVDVILGYEKVLKLRSILQRATDKIIPVWHKGRGVKEFDRMCREFSGRIIAISGFKNEDINDNQYLMFLKHAKKYNCKVHCLGMTRRDILDRVPFDYTDSSSWRQPFCHARAKINGKRERVDSMWFKRFENRDKVELRCYLEGMKMQKEYYEKWRGLK